MTGRAGCGAGEEGDGEAGGGERPGGGYQVDLRLLPRPGSDITSLGRGLTESSWDLGVWT